MTYQEKKEKIRSEAMEFQASFDNYNYSYGELFEIQTYFIANARKYGLMKEFKENGII